MKLSLKAEFERLGPVRAVDRVQSGSRARFFLTLKRQHWSQLNAIAATQVMAKHGMTMLAAKRTIEAMIDESKDVGEGCASIVLPVVESVDDVIADLSKAGIKAVHNDHKASVDVAAIRKRLKLSRRTFALWYGLEEETIKGWENGDRIPDTAAKSYLRVIANAPEAVRDAYGQSP